MENRKIEFRVWDKVSNIWVAGWRITQSGCSSQHNAYVLMQFTGLADKNGKEIFEDDLVRKENRVGRIVFRDCAFTVAFQGEDQVWYPAAHSYLHVFRDSLEKIGNIWENPELLKEAN